MVSPQVMFTVGVKFKSTFCLTMTWKMNTTINHYISETSYSNCSSFIQQINTKHSHSGSMSESLQSLQTTKKRIKSCSDSPTQCLCPAGCVYLKEERHTFHTQRVACCLACANSGIMSFQWCEICNPDYIIWVIWAHIEDSKLLTTALQIRVLEIQ